MKKLFGNLVLFFVLMIVVPVNVMACDNAVNIYLFHSRDCSHCKEEIKLLEELEDKYSNLNIYKYEIHDEANKKIFDEVLDIYDVRSAGVPFLVIGDSYYIGYNLVYSRLKIIKTIDYYTKYGYEDRIASIVGNDVFDVCKIYDGQVSVEDFLEDYHNYKIVGSVYTDDIDLQVMSVLTSFLSEFNLVNFMFIFILIMIVSKLCLYKDKIIMLLFYFCTYLIFNILKMVSSKLFLVLLVISVLGLIILFVSKFKKCYIIGIMLGCFNSLLKIIFYNRYIDIFLNVLELHKLSIINVVFQYLIYIFGMVSSFVILIIVINNVIRIANKVRY